LVDSQRLFIKHKGTKKKGTTKAVKFSRRAAEAQSLRNIKFYFFFATWHLSGSKSLRLSNQKSQRL